MRYLWITALSLLLSGCGVINGGLGNANTRSFVAAPVPDEIRVVIYTTETSAGSNIWRLNNDDLRIRHTTKSRSGKILSDRTRKMTPNDYNWVVYNLEQSNFTKVKSIPGRGPSSSRETLTAITQSSTYSYTQNSTTRFPNGFQKVVSVIPGFSNPKK